MPRLNVSFLLQNFLGVGFLAVFAGRVNMMLTSKFKLYLFKVLYKFKLRNKTKTLILIREENVFIHEEQMFVLQTQLQDGSRLTFKSYTSFHPLPSPVHPTGFPFCFFRHSYLVIIEQQHYISFSCFTSPGAAYWIFLPFLPWLPCHFYLVVIAQQQLSIRNRFLGV